MNKFISNNKLFYHINQLFSWKFKQTVSPVTAEVHLTNICNNKCYYCGQEFTKNNSSLTIKDIQKTADFLEQIRVKGVYFSGGGEPTLSQDFIAALNIFKEKKFDLGLITNGTSLGQLEIDTILNTCKWVRISLDASDKKTYNKIRGTDHFDNVVDNIKQLLKSKKELSSKTTIGLQVVVNRHNYSQLAILIFELMFLFKEIDYIQVRPIETKINESPYNLSEIIKIREQLAQLKRYKKLIISDKFEDIFNKNKNFGFSACHCSDFILTVDAKKDVYLCCHTIGRYEYKFCTIEDSNSFFIKRKNKIKALGHNLGLNPAVCFLGCRGSGINKALESIVNIPENNHNNFL